MERSELAHYQAQDYLSSPGEYAAALEAQGKTVEVLHTLRPLIVVMAGANEFDPYKD